MGALLGLGVGLGLLLIWSVFAVPTTPTARTALLRTRLDRAGLHEMSAAGLIGLCLACAAVAALVAYVVSSTVPVAVVFAAIAGWAPYAAVASRGRKRDRELAEVWPDAVDDLASAVRSGMSLPEALSALSIRGPGPLRTAFEQFALDYQVTGRFGDCLDRLKDRLADPVGDRVIEGLRIARDVGGGELGRLLRNLSGFLREELRTRAELEARQAWSVNGARLAVAAPWIVLGFMSFQTDAIQRFSTPAGTLIIAFGALACVVAYRLMLRIGRLPQTRRVMS